MTVTSVPHPFFAQDAEQLIKFAGALAVYRNDHISAEVKVYDLSSGVGDRFGLKVA